MKHLLIILLTSLFLVSSASAQSVRNQKSAQILLHGEVIAYGSYQGTIDMIINYQNITYTCGVQDSLARSPGLVRCYTTRHY